MEFDQAFAGNGDWNFPSPGATPTNPIFGNVLQTPKTATFPSHFQDAFNTPQMQAYTTPQQPQYSSMTAVQRPQSSSEILRSNYYAGMQANGAHNASLPFQAGYAAPAVSPGIHHGFQMSPAQQATQMSFTSSQMQTPPPTRGMSHKKSQQPSQIAFGTPSTIASRRFLTPQQEVPMNAMVAGLHTPMPLPQLQFSPDMYQFANMGPASAPVMPQTQLLWDQMGSPISTVPQQNPLEDPFAPAMQRNPAWSGQLQAMSFETPEKASFPVQPPHLRPMSAAAMNNNFAHSTPAAPTSAGLDPSLIYSSPLRPIARSSSRASNKGRPEKAQVRRKDSAMTSKSQAASISPVESEPAVSGPGLRRSNTTGPVRPSSAQSTANLLETLNRSNSFTQVPRTASPLKRAGRTPLGSISEHKPRHRASVVLTVDENGIARTETRHAEESPTRSIRERYPGLFDSDTSDGDSDTSEQPPSRSASFTFVKGEERRTKAARLDPPVENLEGLSIPRSSSRTSNKSVTPSRAAIVAAAQLRRQGSVKRPSRAASAKRNPMSSSTGSLIDSCPMDMSTEQQQAVAGANMRNGSDEWTAMPGQGRSANALDAHNRRWSMMSFEQHHVPALQNLAPGPLRTAPLIRYLVALASILVSPPPADTSAAAAFPHETRRLLTDLPSHLRCKYPCLSTLCATHKTLNPLPLVSLWDGIRHDIEHELHKHWTPLAAEGSMTAAQSHFITRLRLHAWHVRANDCAACSLSRLATDFSLLIALGAITIATLSPNNWRKSKRVYFFERQLQQLQDRNHGSDPEDAVGQMFELGSELRRLRERLRALHDWKKGHRPHVAEYVARYYDASAPPPRPLRSPEQEDHVSVAASLSPKGGRLVEIAERMTGTTPKFTVARKPLPATAKPNIFEEAFRYRANSGEPKVEDNVSSTCSHDRLSGAKGSHHPSTRASSVTEGPHDSDRLDLCGQHNLFTGSHSAGPTSESSPSPPPPPSPPRRYSRFKLAPITIPRGQFGVEPALRTSGLWARRFEVTAPRLRAGKTSVVKGPLDPLSEVNLVAGERESWEGLV